MKLFKILILTALICMIYADYEDNFNEKEIVSRSFLRKFGSCFASSDCLPDEYCYYQSKTIINRCLRKGFDGQYCIYDERCQSGHCMGFKCVGRKITSDTSPHGRCNKNFDCHYDQYCNKNKCIDREKEGSCSNDAQCLSNRCSFFRCKKLNI
jgi:hypothetical protein